MQGLSLCISIWLYYMYDVSTVYSKKIKRNLVVYYLVLWLLNYVCCFVGKLKFGDYNTLKTILVHVNRVSSKKKLCILLVTPYLAAYTFFQFISPFVENRHLYFTSNAWLKSGKYFTPNPSFSLALQTSSHIWLMESSMYHSPLPHKNLLWIWTVTFHTNEGIL